MSKKEITIEYQPVNISQEESDFRLFQSLNMLINNEDLYGHEKNKNNKVSKD